MNFPPHLLDALGWIYAEVALERWLKDTMADGHNDVTAAELDAPPAIQSDADSVLDGLVTDPPRD